MPISNIYACHLFLLRVLYDDYEQLGFKSCRPTIEDMYHRYGRRQPPTGYRFASLISVSVDIFPPNLDSFPHCFIQPPPPINWRIVWLVVRYLSPTYLGSIFIGRHLQSGYCAWTVCVQTTKQNPPLHRTERNHYSIQTLPAGADRETYYEKVDDAIPTGRNIKGSRLASHSIEMIAQGIIGQRLVDRSSHLFSKLNFRAAPGMSIEQRAVSTTQT